MIETPTGGELYYQADSVKHDPARAETAAAENSDCVSQNPYGSLNPRKENKQILAAVADHHCA